jgi:hypothetical protein
MKIVGCDLHTRYQQVAMVDKETGELIERRLEHESGEARAFYSDLAVPGAHFSRSLREVGWRAVRVGECIPDVLSAYPGAKTQLTTHSPKLTIVRSL